MKHKKIMFSSIAFSMLLTTNAYAQNEETNQKWDKPVYIEGADLSGNNEKETEEKLNVKDDFETFKVSVDDVSKYVPDSSNLSYIYSSATIEKKRFRSGVDVEITTPENITKVTTEQYRNAAITAGIQDANIKIASISPVTGEGALAGIYKAYEMKGNSLNKEDIQNANQEMNDLATISEENQNSEGYSDEALNASIAEIKQQLAEVKQQQDEQLTQQDVEHIVNDVLQERGLDQIINDNHKQIIINNMVNVANSNTLNHDPKAFEKQANDLTKSIKSNASDKLEQAQQYVKSDEGKNLLQRIWDSIMNIINRIVEFFKGLF
ncbi:TPA: DUF1002 domain-containing protein [Staphylococcus aureus]